MIKWELKWNKLGKPYRIMQICTKILPIYSTFKDNEWVSYSLVSQKFPLLGRYGNLFPIYSTIESLTIMAKKRKRSQSIEIIKKANELIEARYRFDIWETRVFLSVLANIHRDDEDFKPYRIRYNEMIKSFDLKSHQSYDLLRKGARSLMSKTFMVDNTVNGFDRVKEYHIIRTVDYLKDGQEGSDIENQEYIDITVEPEMKPLLLQLQKNFTAYNLKHVAKLGAQPIRMYELLKQYQAIGHRLLYVEDMRRILGYEKEYPRFADFHRYFIKPAIDAINKETDIEVYKEEKIKKGRKIDAIHFYFRAKSKEKETPKKRIKSKPENTNLSMEQTDKDRLFEQYREVVISKFGVTPSVFMKLLENCEEAGLEQAIRVTQRAKYHQQIKSNVAGFFVQALRMGYTDTKEERKKTRVGEKQKKQEKARATIFEHKAQHAQQLNDIIRELTTEQPDIAEYAIKALAENRVSKAILDEKENELGRILSLEDFRQDRVLREMVKAKIIELEPSRFESCIKNYEVQMRKLENNVTN